MIGVLDPRKANKSQVEDKNVASDRIMEVIMSARSLVKHVPETVGAKVRPSRE